MKEYKGWYFPDSEEHFLEHLKQSNSSEYQKAQRYHSFNFLDHKRTAIDVGANVGLWSKDICKIFDEVKLFEPYRLNIECLKKNLENYQNFQIFECALSNKDGIGDLFINDKELGGISLASPQGKFKTTSTQLKKLDDFHFNNIDYIKIDVERYELEVIEGGIMTLKNNNPVLCIEAPRRNKEELSYVKKILTTLENLDYKIVGSLHKEIFLKKNLNR